VSGGSGIAAGIYMDNYTNHVQVKNNMISDTSIGVLLNETHDNIVSGNKTWKTRQAGFRASGRAAFPLTNNIVSTNTFFAARYFNEGSSGGPQEFLSPGEYWSSEDKSSMVTFGAGGNRAQNNKIVSLSDTDRPLWQHFGPGGIYGIDGRNDYTGVSWNALGNTDTQITPFSIKEAIVNPSGVSLIQNGTMEISTTTPWKTYFATKGAGSLTFGSRPGCNGSCAQFIPGTGGDLLISNTFNLITSPSTLYYIQYTEAGGVLGGGSAATVRRIVSPYDSFGYNKTHGVIAQGEKITVKNFFYATSSENARLDLYGKAGGETLYDDVSLVPVSSYELFDPYKYSAHLINEGETPKQFSCTDSGMSSCDAYDDGGAHINWPVSVLPHSSLIIIGKDAKWAK
jgi:parallel beta-helix repeat protein